LFLLLFYYCPGPEEVGLKLRGGGGVVSARYRVRILC